MSTSTASCSLGTSAAAVAYDAAHTKMAVYDTSGRLSVWARADGPKPWVLASSWPIAGARVAAMCWAPGEFGSVLCCGMSDGRLVVWEERLKGTGWAAVADLKKSDAGVLDLRFAPQQLGPLLAAAYADGIVRCGPARAPRWGAFAAPRRCAGRAARANSPNWLAGARRFFQASDVLAAQRWELSNELEATPSGQPCTSLSWRQQGGGLPPMLLVGTRDAAAQVWAYQTSTMRWELAASVGSPTVRGRGRSRARRAGGAQVGAAPCMWRCRRVRPPPCPWVAGGLQGASCDKRGLGSCPGPAIRAGGGRRGRAGRAVELARPSGRHAGAPAGLLPLVPAAAMRR